MKHRLLAPLVLLALMSAAPTAATETSRPDDLVIEHVDVLPMTAAGRVLRDRTVVVQDGRIRHIARGRGPAGVKRIDGRGKVLMPGLADMHVHIEDGPRMARLVGGGPEVAAAFPTGDLLLPYVANGVLQVFNLSASAEALKQKEAVESGTVLGPRQALAVMVDGDPPMNRAAMATAVRTPDEGREAVRRTKAQGFDAVKTYSALSFETYSAILDEANKVGLRVVGHIPLRGKDRTAELLQPAFLVAHTEEFAYQTPEVDVAAIPRFAALAMKERVWLISTLDLNDRVVERTLQPELLARRAELRYVHPFTVASWLQLNAYAAGKDKARRRQQVADFNPQLLQAFRAEGVPWVTGTDAFVAGMMPGFGLHDELLRLSRAGVPNGEILVAATRRPAEWLGTAADRGTVEVGKRADLLLLDANPLADVRNARKIAAVIVGGRLYERRELDARMEDLAKRYASMPKPDLSGFRSGGHLDDRDDH